jgi:hypothetical protein
MGVREKRRQEKKNTRERETAEATQSPQNPATGADERLCK